MNLEANKALVRRYFEDAPNNPAACDEIFADKLWLWQQLGVMPETKDAIARAKEELHSTKQLLR